jgi:hypothetical protein
MSATKQGHSEQPSVTMETPARRVLCKVVICVPRETQRLMRLWTKSIMPYRFLPAEGDLDIVVAVIEVDQGDAKQLNRLSRVVKGIARSVPLAPLKKLKFLEYRLVRKYTDQAHQTFVALYGKPAGFDVWIAEMEQDLSRTGAKLVIDRATGGRRRRHENNYIGNEAVVVPLLTAIETWQTFPATVGESLREPPDIFFAPQAIGLAGPGARVIQKYL